MFLAFTPSLSPIIKAPSKITKPAKALVEGALGGTVGLLKKILSPDGAKPKERDKRKLEEYDPPGFIRSPAPPWYGGSCPGVSYVMTGRIINLGTYATGQILGVSTIPIVGPITFLGTDVHENGKRMFYAKNSAGQRVVFNAPSFGLVHAAGEERVLVKATDILEPRAIRHSGGVGHADCGDPLGEEPPILEPPYFDPVYPIDEPTGPIGEPTPPIEPTDEVFPPSDDEPTVPPIDPPPLPHIGDPSPPIGEPTPPIEPTEPTGPIGEPTPPIPPSEPPITFEPDPMPDEEEPPPPIEPPPPPIEPCVEAIEECCEETRLALEAIMAKLVLIHNAILALAELTPECDLSPVLAELAVIQNKLGEQIEDGLSGGMTLQFEAAALDRYLLLRILGNAEHISLKLSNNFRLTALAAIQGALNLAQFKPKDITGNFIDFSSLITDLPIEVSEAILGAEVIDDALEDWLKANRVYQSTSNLQWFNQQAYDSLRSLLYLAINIMGNIGNGLIESGCINEETYEFFPELVDTTCKPHEAIDELVELGSTSKPDLNPLDWVTNPVIETASIEDIIVDSRDLLASSIESEKIIIETDFTINKTSSVGSIINDDDTIKP